MSTESFHSIEPTPKALERIAVLSGQQGSNQFRVYVTGGGCSGFQYGFKFDPEIAADDDCLLYTSPSPRDKRQSRMPSSA